MDAYARHFYPLHLLGGTGRAVSFLWVPKYPLEKKMFGIFEHYVCEGFGKLPIFRGFDDVFFVPHSRHTEVRRKDIERCPELQIVSESEDSAYIS